MAGTSSLEVYQAGRQAFLEQVIAGLSQDGRFTAGWLSGSFGRGEQDALSDLDLTVIVRQDSSVVLCQRPWQVSAQTTPERWALFSRFGQPVIVHENHRNAPEDGTFTFVLYADPPVMVDWVLCPQGSAVRPLGTKLLWEHNGNLPVPTEVTPDQEQAQVAEMAAFFWMMSAVTLKHIYRRDWDFTATWIGELDRLIYEVEGRLTGSAKSYQAGAFQSPAHTCQDQAAALQELAERMAVLVPQVQAGEGQVLEAPTATLQILTGLVREAG